MNNKKRRNPKGPTRKNYERRDERGGKIDRVRDDRMDAKNDISWYSKYPELLVASGSFPYPYRPGMKVPLGTQFASPRQAVQPQIPGVLTLDWMPSVGKSNSATDPASVMGKEYYARVRKAYAGTLDADAPDYVMYFMALDSIFAYIAWLKRVYRVLNAWTPMNHILPDRLLGAMGLSNTVIQNLRTNRMQFWQLINQLVLQSRKFPVPALMDIMNRHYWMSDNVYTDSPSINSQFYIFNLKAVYKFANLPVSGGTEEGAGLQVVPMPWCANPAAATAEDFYNFGLELIQALDAWDDAYTINGYLMRAFEGTPTFIVDEIPQDQPFTPVYEEEVLVQIENSAALPLGNHINIGTPQWSNFNVTQDPLTNSVVCNPTYKVPNANSYAVETTTTELRPWISVRRDQPTVADSVVATRLKCTVEHTQITPTETTYVVHAATEIPIAWRYRQSGSIAADEKSLSYAVAMKYNYITANKKWEFSGDVHALADMLYLEQFDWHPISLVFLITQTDGAQTQYESYFAGDVHNITQISVDDLDNLHTVCIYSEMNSFGIF